MVDTKNKTRINNYINKCSLAMRNAREHFKIKSIKGKHLYEKH